MQVLLVILGAIGLVLAWGVRIYNKLISYNQQVEEAKSGISTVLKQRFDLLPNLVETVKGYAKHEKSIFEDVTKLRSKWQNIDLSKADVKTLQELDQASSSILGRLVAVSENYPDLKASQNFLQLQNTLNDIEEKLARARRFYNAVVKDFNTLVLSFPSNLVANFMHLKQKPYFEVKEEETKAPKIEF